MEKKLTLKSITAKDLWNILKRCYLIVIAVAILVTAVLYIRAKVNYVPIYSSTATVVLIGESDGEFDVNEFANDYNIATRIMEECKYLMKSRRVLNTVGEEIGVSNGYGALNGSVIITVPEDTRIFNITVMSSSPERAKKIADSVAKNGIMEIQETFDYDRLRVFEEGTLNTYPSNSISFSTYLVYGLIGGMAVYVVFLLLFLFDNYIHTEDDIEQYLGLSILGEIPDANYARRKRYSAYTTEKMSTGSAKKKGAPKNSSNTSNGKKG